MNATAPAAPPVFRRAVSRDSRDFSAASPPSGTPPLDKLAAMLTDRRKAILLKLLAAIDGDGRQWMTSRAELRTNVGTVREMYWSGWINGAGSRDERGTGNTPETSWWWLTTYGEQLAREIAKEKVA